MPSPRFSNFAYLLPIILAWLAVGCQTTRHAKVEPLPAPEDRTVYNDPIDRYNVHDAHGWTIRVSHRLDSNPEVRDKAFNDVTNQLYRISTLLPEHVVTKLRETEIWIEHALPKRAQYHPSERWLKENGYNPAKRQTVEIACAEDFLDWRDEAVMTLLHELFHAYHDQVIGFNDKRVIAAYKRAQREKLYDKIMLVNGKQVKHYAMETPQEFFAEMSEAFFFVNDYFPFVRGELKTYDPKTYKLMQEIWNLQR